MGWMKNTKFVTEVDGKNHLGDLGIDGRLTLRSIIKKLGAWI
jgi:hypothetical protein